jgi:hypothetical protein
MSTDQKLNEYVHYKADLKKLINLANRRGLSLSDISTKLGRCKKYVQISAYGYFPAEITRQMSLILKCKVTQFARPVKMKKRVSYQWQYYNNSGFQPLRKLLKRLFSLRFWRAK